MVCYVAPATAAVSLPRIRAVAGVVVAAPFCVPSLVPPPVLLSVLLGVVSPSAIAATAAVPPSHAAPAARSPLTFATVRSAKMEFARRGHGTRDPLTLRLGFHETNYFVADRRLDFLAVAADFDGLVFVQGVTKVVYL